MRGYLGAGAYLLVQLPFRRIEKLDRLRSGFEFLLDPRAARPSRDVRVRDARIFVDFAKQVLAVDQLEPPSPQRLKVEAQPLEFLLLQIGHEPDQFRLVE